MTDRRTGRFDEVYRLHGRAVLAYCMRRTSQQDAMDAASEVFVIALRKIEAVPHGEEALPWLYATAKNVLRNRERARRRQVRLKAKMRAEPRDAVPGPDVQLIMGEEQNALLAALGRLSPKDQEVLRLVEWDGLSREQVAAMHYVSRAAIDKRISRAYRRLRRELGVREDKHTAPVPIEDGGEA